MSEETIDRQPVWVKKSGVDPKDVTLSKSASEQIVWKSEIKGTITFADSPFAWGAVYQLKVNGATPSGPIDKKKPEGEYPYTVEDEDGNEIDPRVFIDK